MCRSVTLLLLLSFSGLTAFSQSKVEITVKNGTERELRTKDQLQRLLKTYDLSKWTYTNAVVIDEKSIPHSHPILTLHTRHLKDDDLLLSTYIHEQFHWLLVINNTRRDEAIKEVRTMFPKVPLTSPEGARDENSTYLHLLVCYLEFYGIRDLLGELRAKQVMDFWATDHYTWVYRTVSEKHRDIGSILRKHDLMPPAR